MGHCPPGPVDIDKMLEHAEYHMKRIEDAAASNAVNFLLEACKAMKLQQDEHDAKHLRLIKAMQRTP